MLTVLTIWFAQEILRNSWLAWDKEYSKRSKKTTMLIAATSLLLASLIFLRLLYLISSSYKQKFCYIYHQFDNSNTDLFRHLSLQETVSDSPDGILYSKISTFKHRISLDFC